MDTAETARGGRNIAGPGAPTPAAPASSSGSGGLIGRAPPDAAAPAPPPPPDAIKDGAAALEKDLTELARRLTRDSALHVVFDQCQWAYSPKRHLLVAPSALFAAYTHDGLKGALCREIGRWMYSRGPAIMRPPNHAFCLLWHAVDQVRTNKLALQRLPEAQAFLRIFYQESLAALNREDDVPSLAESFVRHLIAQLMFGAGMEVPISVTLAYDACAPHLMDSVEPPSSIDLATQSLSYDAGTDLADQLFWAVRQHVWPAYQALLVADVEALAMRPTGDDDAEVEPPPFEAQWPWTFEDQGPLAYDPTGMREMECAKQQLRDCIRRWAGAERTARLDEIISDGFVTWEQAMRRKPLMPEGQATESDFLAQVERLRRHVVQADAVALGAGDTSAYAVIRRREHATIEALRTAISAVTAHEEARLRAKYFTSGKYELRRGLEARNRERMTGVRDERVCSRRRRLERPAPQEFVFCIDVSGSMHGANIEAARAAFVVFQEALIALDIPAGSLMYNSEATLLNEIGHPTPEQRRAALDRVVSSGGNNEPLALTLAQKMFNRSQTKQQIILFLTDGGAAVNTKNTVVALERDTHVRVIGIGIGAGCGQVTSVYGNNLVVAQVEELPRRVAQLLQNVLQGNNDGLPFEAAV